MTRTGRRLPVIAAAAVALAALFLTVQGPIDPQPYRPPAAPAMDGPLAANELLRAAERIAVGRIHGPEDVAVDAAGRIYGGTVDGRIVRVTVDEDGGETLWASPSTPPAAWWWPPPSAACCASPATAP